LFIIFFFFKFLRELGYYRNIIKKLIFFGIPNILENLRGCFKICLLG
jgi:hypothetical protein